MKRAPDRRWPRKTGNLGFHGFHKKNSKTTDCLKFEKTFRMSSDAKYEESNLSKLSFDPECQYFSLKVPKGFDVNQLKVSFSAQHFNLTSVEFNFSTKSLF